MPRYTRHALFGLCQTLPAKQFKLNIAKKEVDFIETSFKPYGLSCMSNPAFLNNVIEFGKMGKDKINEETIEFLVPYLEIDGFNPQARIDCIVGNEGVLKEPNFLVLMHLRLAYIL